MILKKIGTVADKGLNPVGLFSQQYLIIGNHLTVVGEGNLSSLQLYFNLFFIKNSSEQISNSKPRPIFFYECF
jgi:hypothetical protein